MMKAKTKKTTKFTTKYLDKLIEEATTDAYNESEQAGAFLVMIEENLALPFVTQVLGQEVTVGKVDITKRDQIVAICGQLDKLRAVAGHPVVYVTGALASYDRLYAVRGTFKHRIARSSVPFRLRSWIDSPIPPWTSPPPASARRTSRPPD
jgi:hypothetical protein